MTEITVVMFRVWTGRNRSDLGDNVIALFPCEPGRHRA
jgi:hypothetical protein